MSFRGVPQDMADGRVHRRDLARAVNALLRGKLNCTADVTLTPAATSTVVSDDRIWPGSALLFVPLTASAAAVPAPYAASADIGKGAATLTHASDAAADQTFRMIILG